MATDQRRPPVSPVRAGILALQVALVSTAIQTTNPDYNFPGVVELLLIGTALVCLGLTLRRRGVWDRGDGWVAGLLVMLIGLLGIRYALAFGDPANAGALGCFALPGTVNRVECLLQLPAWTNFGLRQLLAHATALAVFLAMAGLARSARSQAASLAPLLLLTPVLFAVAAVSPKFIPGGETLAGWNFVQNEIGGTARGSGLTSNPGWLWPLLMAPGALAAGLLASVSVWRRVVGAVALAIILFAIGDAGQRGGMLGIGLFLGCAVSFGLLWRLPRLSGSWPRRLAVTAGSLAACVVAVLIGAPIINAAAEWLSQFSGFEGFGARRLVLVDSHRAVMWQCAWDGLRPVFWGGNGYASWLRVASSVCPGSRDIYDTAHNLWVQMFFELGAVHATIAVAAIVGLIARGLTVQTRRPIEVQAAAVALVPAFLLVSIVQEVDYIRATYYLFASIAGYVWGSSWSSDRAVAAPASDGGRRRLVPAVVVVAGMCAFIGSPLYLRTISWGGYTVAPDTDHPGFLFSRWFRPDGAIATMADESGRSFSVFPFAVALPRELRVVPKAAPATDFAMTPTGITAANGAGPVPRQYRYAANVKVEWLSRLNAFSVLLPPLQSNYLVFAESGTSAWEVSADRTPYKWCFGACAIEFSKVAPGERRREIWVDVDSGCISPGRPARVRYVLDGMVAERAGAIRLIEADLTFTEAGAPQRIVLPRLSMSTERWRLALAVDPGCPAAMVILGQ